MPWVKFSEKFVYVPPKFPQTAISYKAGTSRLVTQDCAEKAVKAGKGRIVRRTVKKAEDDGIRTDAPAAELPSSTGD